MLDWQTIAVALMILAACAYTGRRALSRLRSFRAAGNSDTAACATGCGNCGGESRQTTKPAPIMIQISTQRTTPSRQSR